MYFKANFSHIFISLLRKPETLQDAFIHSSSGPPNTCLRQFCEKIGAPAFLTLHKTHEGGYPCQRNREISVSQTLAALIHNHIFLTFFRFFWYFLIFLTFSHLCTGRSTYLLATARKQADHPSCNIHTNIHSHVHILLFQKTTINLWQKLTKLSSCNI